MLICKIKHLAKPMSLISSASMLAITATAAELGSTRTTPQASAPCKQTTTPMPHISNSLQCPPPFSYLQLPQQNFSMQITKNWMRSISQPGELDIRENPFIFITQSAASLWTSHLPFTLHWETKVQAIQSEKGFCYSGAVIQLLN